MSYTVFAGVGVESNLPQPLLEKAMELLQDDSESLSKLADWVEKELKQNTKEI